MYRSIPLSSQQTRLLEESARGVHRDLLAAIREVSHQLGYRAFLVGGVPRDLILCDRVGDLDLVVEGDGVKFALGLAEILGGTVRTHVRFGTAVLEGLGARLDVAGTRTEEYVSPAALPAVQAGLLADDLLRRDFTVNTLAIEVSKEPPFEIRDSFGGVEDLQQGRLKVLHADSFLDDPTRVLRGIRFETQLGLRLDATAEELARSAVESGVFDALSGDRLRREIFRLMEPAASVEARLHRMRELGLLGILHPAVSPTEEDMEWIGTATEASRDLPADLGQLEGWRLVFPVLMNGLDAKEKEELAERLALRAEEKEWLLGSREAVDRALGVLRRPAVTPHEIDRVLRCLRSEQIPLLLAFGSSPVVQWVELWLDELRSVEFSLTGSDLLDAGYSPGPWIGQALEATRDARLDGVIAKEDELRFAIQQLKSKDIEVDGQ